MLAGWLVHQLFLFTVFFLVPRGYHDFLVNNSHVRWYQPNTYIRKGIHKTLQGNLRWMIYRSSIQLRIHLMTLKTKLEMHPSPPRKKLKNMLYSRKHWIYSWEVLVSWTNHVGQTIQVIQYYRDQTWEWSHTQPVGAQGHRNYTIQTNISRSQSQISLDALLHTTTA